MRFWFLLTFICVACTSVADREAGDRGKQVYAEFCSRCHDSGLHGAQRIGDREGWRSRLGQGVDILVEHSIRGYEGAVGHMPPRGGHPELSDGDIAAAVNYIIAESR